MIRGEYKDREFALIVMRDELYFRQNKIERLNLEIEKNRQIIAEQKVKMDEVKAEIERLERL